MKTDAPPVVRPLTRAFMEKVVELEAAAAADRRLIYEGVPWTAGGIREFLRAGQGFVAVNPHGSVVGFALFRFPPDRDELLVAKFVVPTRICHAVMVNALIARAAQERKSRLNLPLVLEIE